MTDKMLLNKPIQKYLDNTRNPSVNFELAYTYEKMYQFASAASFYNRAAEFSLATNDTKLKLLAYEALLRLGICFEKLGSRNYVLKGILLRAISLYPQRPEGYFMLSRTYEHTKEWHESYAWAVMGEMLETPTEKLITNVEYPDKYVLSFQRGVAAWWIGLFKESMDIMKEISELQYIEEKYKLAALNNLINLQDKIKTRISL